MKLALVLYARAVPGRAARSGSRRSSGMLSPLVLVVGAARCCSSPSQPDLGTALVIASRSAALLVAAGMPMRHLGDRGRRAARVLVVLLALVRALPARAPDGVPGPVGARRRRSGFQAVQGQIALGSGGLFGVGLGAVGAEDLLPARGPHRLHPRGHRRGARRRRASCGVLVALRADRLRRACGSRRRRPGRYAKLLAAGLTSLILCQAMLNVFAVLGLAPLTGVPLPFISYGLDEPDRAARRRWACC